MTLKVDRPILSDISNDLVVNVIQNFFQHARVFKIRQVRNPSDCFSIKSVTIEDIF